MRRLILKGPRHDVGTLDRYGDRDANRGLYFAALADMGLRGRQSATSPDLLGDSIYLGARCRTHYVPFG